MSLELLLEVGLDVLLVLLDWSLLLLDQEVFGCIMALATILHQLGDLGFVPSVDTLKCVREEHTLNPIDDIHFFGEIEDV